MEKVVCGEKHSFIKLAYVVGADVNSNVYEQHMLLNKETYFETYIYQESCPLALSL